MTIRILLEIANMDRDENPEVVFYHYDDDATELTDYGYSLFASSEKGNGRYDKISAEGVGVDGDGVVNEKDEKLYLQLADAFAQFKAFAPKR